jgi:hypothetical protein
VNPLPFRTLLYRYFFFGWLFKDIDGCGANLFERAAVLRHNHRQAAWLPVYIRRWLGCSGLLCAAGAALESWLDAPGMGMVLYALGGMCMSAAITTTTAWLGLRQQPT